MIDGKYGQSLIYRRHSVRKFTDEAVSPEQMEHILHAAMAAPSAHNTQPWAFVVIEDRAMLARISEFHPYAKMMAGAAAAVLVCVLRAVADENKFYQQDMGACLQNLLLAAAESGLGACWCGVHPVAELEEKFTALCGLPGEVFPFAVVALGCPIAAPEPSDRYDAQRVHRTVW